MISEIISVLIFSAFTICILLCYRVCRFLNLSFGSIFALGAHLATLSPLLSLLAGSIAGIALHRATRSLKLPEATIVSLGFGLGIEETLRLTFRGSQYIVLAAGIVRIVGEAISIPELAAGVISAAFIVSLLAALNSGVGLKLKFVEENSELAELYGIDTESARLLILTATSALICLLGATAGAVQAIHPAMGWPYLTFSVIAATPANLFGRHRYAAAVLVNVACLLWF